MSYIHLRNTEEICSVISPYFYMEAIFVEKEDKVYIPKNVKNELEFFRGFEIKELIITIVIGIPSAIPTFFIY